MISKISFSLINAALLLVSVYLFISSVQSALLSENFSPVIFPLLLMILFLTNIISNWKNLGVVVSCLQAIACVLIIPITLISFAIAGPIVMSVTVMIINAISEQYSTITIDEAAIANIYTILDILPLLISALMVLLTINIAYQYNRFRQNVLGK